MSDRLYRVMLVHQKIHRAIEDSRRARSPDALELVRLKKLKLRAKDIMHRLMRTPQHG